MKCHIWPPKSGSPGYRLGGGKVALRQGFYFYRNDRVIQSGRLERPPQRMTASRILSYGQG